MHVSILVMASVIGLAYLCRRIQVAVTNTAVTRTE